MRRERVAVTMGDPAGIGPEVILKALSAPLVRRAVAPLLIGDIGVFRDAARRLRLPLAFAGAGDAVPRGAVPVIETSALAARQRAPRRPSAAGGDAAYQAIVGAVDAVRSDAAAAIATAPISKENLAAAGYDYPGHTELLTHLTDARGVRMMMAGPRLRVVLATTHLALRRVPDALTTRLVGDTIAAAHVALRRWFGVPRPRIAVCGLNPHAGEGGLFGSEDTHIIEPAVAQARRRGVRASGPLPADSVFPHAAAGQYDVVVCMYHDQGLAPFKLLHFADGVNVTLGLPFVRTSPDHGTAFDIAGRNRADPSSMIAALRLAARLSARQSTC